MSDRLTRSELNRFEKFLQSRFPNLGITVTPYPPTEWKINAATTDSADIDAIKEAAANWYIDNRRDLPEFGTVRYIE